MAKRIYKAIQFAGATKLPVGQSMPTGLDAEGDGVEITRGANGAYEIRAQGERFKADFGGAVLEVPASNVRGAVFVEE